MCGLNSNLKISHSFPVSPPILSACWVWPHIKCLDYKLLLHYKLLFFIRRLFWDESYAQDAIRAEFMVIGWINNPSKKTNQLTWGWCCCGSNIQHAWADHYWGNSLLGTWHDKQKYLVTGNKSLQKPHIRVLIVPGIIIWVEDDLQWRGAASQEWLLSLFAYCRPCWENIY